MRFDQLSLEYKTIVWAQDGDEMAEAEEVSKKFEEFNDLLELAVDAYEDETSTEDKIETLEEELIEQQSIAKTQRLRSTQNSKNEAKHAQKLAKLKSELTKYKSKREEAKKNVQFNFDKISEMRREILKWTMY